MIKNNFHSHTIYCVHATQTVEELILQAISKNFKAIGISEHSYFENYLGKWRLRDLDTAMKYIAEVNKYKEKYKDKIKVFCGFESEPYNHIIEKGQSEMVDKLSKIDGVDYIVVGNHFFSGLGESGYVGDVSKPTAKQAKDYIFYLEELLKKVKKIIMIAHPDVLLNRDDVWSEEHKYIVDNIIRLSLEFDVPLGINVNAFYNNKKHPDIRFWRLAAKNKVKATIEIDSHDAGVWENDIYIKKALDLAKEVGIELIENVYEYKNN